MNITHFTLNPFGEFPSICYVQGYLSSNGTVALRVASRAGFPRETSLIRFAGAALGTVTTDKSYQQGSCLHIFIIN